MVKFDSFNVCENCHIKLKHHLHRQSRDNCENNGNEIENHIFSWILQENCYCDSCSFLTTLHNVWQFCCLWQLSHVREHHLL